MYLVTTAQREFWPESGPIYLLSSGCCADMNDPSVAGRWEIKGVVGDPFQSDEQTTLAYAEIWHITENLIRLLANRLNAVHDTDRSERYWRMHIGLWALLYVTVLYDRYARLLKAMTEIDHPTVIGWNNVTPIIPSDTISFVREAADDLYNCQLYTFLCGSLGMPIEERDAEITAFRLPPVQNSSHSGVKLFLSKSLGAGYVTVISFLARRAEIVMSAPYLPRWFEFTLLLATGGKVLRLYPQGNSNILANPVIDVKARSVLSAIPERCIGIEALAVSMVDRCLPKAFVEDYQEICLRADRVYKNYRPKAIYSANSWWFDEPFKHWAAERQDQGVKLIGGKHGGSAFVRKYDNYEAFEVLLSDYYLTWGVSAPDQTKLVPVPACLLINIDIRAKKISGEGILYGATAEPRHANCFLANFSDYLEWQKRFFMNVSQVVMNKTLVRLHPSDYGWKIKDRLERIAPTLRFDDRKTSFRDRLNSCRLYVCDHYSTTYAEALAANVPTVMFWNEARYPVSRQAIPHIKALKECRILHDTPESAAQWIAQVYDDPGDWWLSEPCQKAVRDFCYLYARTSKTPLREWKDIFRRLLPRTPDMSSKEY